MPEPGSDRAAPAPAPALPRRAHIPGAIVLAIIWLAWLEQLPQGGMLDWGVSAQALAAGRYETVLLHMFAHAGLMHIGFNSAVLFGLAGPLTFLMGDPPAAWARFFAFYLLAGLAGAGLYLALHPGSAVPMLGASGAISGLIGLFARLGGGGRRGLVPLLSRDMGRRVWDFVKANIWLVLLIGVPIVLLGGSGGIAWEAHLGGFVFGLVAAPAVLRRAGRRA